MITTSGSDNSSVEPVAVMPKLPVTVDTKGRLRVSKAQRRDILAALAGSGESLPKFARRTGLKYSTLARWVQVSRAKPSGRKPALRLLEAVVESSPATAAGTVLVLALPGGVRVEVADEKQVALAAILVRALTRPC
jgi:DNA-binding transcriptional regulator YiaG